MGKSALFVLLLNCLRFTIQRAAIREISHQDSQCSSKVCERNTERIKYLLDDSVDPCEDFFQYACSSKNRGKEFPFPKDEVVQNLTKLVVEASGEFGFLKDFYDSCVSIKSQFSTEEVAEYCTHDDKCPKEELEKFGTIYQQFRENIQKFAKHTLPPVLTDDWESKSENFTWQKLSEDILRQEYFLGAFQYVDEKTKPLATENFISNVFFAPMVDHSVQVISFDLHLQYKSLGPQNYTSQLHIIPMTFPGFLEKGSFKDLEKYKQLMVISMKLLGQTNETQIEEDMNKVLNNELHLAQLSKSEYSYYIYDIENGIDDSTYEEIKNKYESDEITLNEMNEKFPSCNWIEFVNNVMDNPDVKVNGSEKVLIPSNFYDIYEFVTELPKREQANLMLWRIFAKFSANFLKTGVEEGAIYKNIFDTEGLSTSRSENCVNQIKTFFPNILDDLIINKYLSPEEKWQIREMFQQIKNEFEDIINSSEWMSIETKNAAIRKLKKMKINVGEIQNNIDHPTEILNQLQKENYLKNIRVLGNAFWKKQVLNLRTPKDIFIGEGEEQAFHVAFFNQIQINVGITNGNSIGLPKNWPKSLVYGGFTTVVGHELTHGYDTKGSQYDENGVKHNWWDLKSKEEFIKRTECMVNQYNNSTFNVDGKIYKANGTHTLRENIADNGGVNIANRAFEKAHRAEKEKMPLQGLNLTDHQLFWVGWAQFWCLLDGRYEGFSTFEQALEGIKGDVHAPTPWRVNTVLSNQKKFAEDFKCPVGSKLNPKERCTVW